eukprot:4158029-Amphidinium_carterae.1
MDSLVSEHHLSVLAKHRNVDVDLASCPSDAQSIDMLRIALFGHVFPDDVTESELAKTLATGRIIEHPDDDVQLDFDAEILRDAVLQTDAPKVLQHLQEEESRNERSDRRRKSQVALLQQRFGAKSAKKSSSSSTAVKSASTVKVTWKGASVSTATDAVQYMRTHGPKVGSVMADISNGRFFLIYPDPIVTRKSVSWHQRGWSESIKQSLEWWYARHSAATGATVHPEFKGF